MANLLNVQIVEDGPRNSLIKIDGILDTSDIAPTVIVDPATLCGIDSSLTRKAAKVRIEKMQYSIEDTLEIRLAWDAPTPTRIVEIVGRGKLDTWEYNGITNNAVAPTGAITLASEGWATGKVLSFTLLLHLIKQQY